jgi:hypothetical protein
MVARILDLIFIQILRAWAAGPDAEPNWLAGALDPQMVSELEAGKPRCGKSRSGSIKTRPVSVSHPRAPPRTRTTAHLP